MRVGRILSSMTALALAGVVGCSGDTLSKTDPRAEVGTPDETNNPNFPDGFDWDPGLPPPSDLPPASTCQTGGLLGRLCTPGSDNELVGAHVYLYAADCNGQVGLYRTESLSNGQFSLAGVPAGNHELVVEWGTTRREIPVTVAGGQIVVVETTSPNQPLCLTEGDPRIAVIGGEFDEVERLLGGLELPYDLYSSEPGTGQGSHSRAFDLLSNYEKLSNYDALYFNCGGLDRDWLFATIVDSETEQSVTFDFEAVTYENLRKFVLHGGNLYVSDWSWPIAKALNRTVLDFYGEESNAVEPLVGVDEAMAADIPDGDLSAFVGAERVPIAYDLEGWAVLDRVGGQAKVHVMGDIAAQKPTGGEQRLADRPLLVSYRPLTGGGLIIFTTFHYHAQPQLQMLNVLRYLIFQI